MMPLKNHSVPRRPGPHTPDIGLTLNQSAFGASPLAVAAALRGGMV